MNLMDDVLVLLQVVPEEVMHCVVEIFVTDAVKCSKQAVPVSDLREEAK